VVARSGHPLKLTPAREDEALRKQIQRCNTAPACQRVAATRHHGAGLVEQLVMYEVGVRGALPPEKAESVDNP